MNYCWECHMEAPGGVCPYHPDHHVDLLRERPPRLSARALDVLDRRMEEDGDILDRLAEPDA